MDVFFSCKFLKILGALSGQLYQLFLALSRHACFSWAVEKASFVLMAILNKESDTMEALLSLCFNFIDFLAAFSDADSPKFYLFADIR
jgi:hypothetical protein